MALTQSPFLAALSANRRFGMKPGLDAIRSVLAALGNPQDAVPVVHVAGTNGKGAVCANLDAVLRAAGFRVGRYTSPHLVSVNERFFLDGAPVSDAALEAAHAAVAPHLPPGGLTYFELLTAMAFVLYARKRPDVLVLETGLGGRLDATNVVAKPLVSAITTIGLDHCDWLGRTLAEIAGEKAGIVKPGVPVVTGVLPPEAATAVAHAAANAAAPLHALAPVVPPLPFPDANRRLVRKIVDVLRTVHGFSIPDSAVATGFASVVWPGRFQRVVSGGVRVLVDGAHNPPACAALVAALAATSDLPPPFALVCGFCGDKDVDENLRILSAGLLKVASHEPRTTSHEPRVWAVPTPNPRTLPPEETAARLRAHGIASCTSSNSLVAALAEAKAFARETGGTVLVCGSLFLAGEALVALGALPPAASSVPCEALNEERTAHA